MTTQVRADAATVTALGSAGISWFDLVQQALEWGVLILGFASGCFALYWNIRKLFLERKGKNNRRSYDKSSN